MSCLLCFLFIILSRENELLLSLFFYEVSNENLKFCTKMFMGSTGKVNQSIATINETFIHLRQLFFEKWD